MAWTVAGALARVARTVGGAARWDAPAALEHAQARAASSLDRPDLFARVASRRIAMADAPDRKALEAALDAAGEDSGVIERAIASGAPIAAVAALAQSWKRLSAEARGIVRSPLGREGTGPVTWGRGAAAVRAVQMDQTTCGPTAMAMALLLTDPFVAAWLATGRRFADYTPPELAGVGEPPTIEARWHAMQRALHARSTRRGLWIAPWPRTLGTPPWAVRSTLRVAGLRLAARTVDDADPRDLAALAAHARAALSDGIPVPLYSSGDSDAGLDSVVPRHVVLLVRAVDDGFHVFEPGTGAVHLLRLSGVAERDPAAFAALGRWSRIAWVVLPRARG